MSLIIYETCVDIAIICATWISRRVSSGRKSEVWISDLAMLDHTHAFLNSLPMSRPKSSNICQDKWWIEWTDLFEYMLVVKCSSCGALYNILLEPGPDHTLITNITWYDYLAYREARHGHLQGSLACLQDFSWWCAVLAWPKSWALGMMTDDLGIATSVNYVKCCRVVVSHSKP